MAILTDYELALLYSANGDQTPLVAIQARAVARLSGMDLVGRPKGTWDDLPDITESGKRFLAENMNNRGVA